MTRDMFVWRKSIYDNNFKCNECGAKLFNVKTGPTNNLALDADAKTEEEKHLCYCAKCQNVVATWQEIEDDENTEEENILMGSYSDWIEKKAMDMKGEMQHRMEEHFARKYEQRIKDLQDKIKSRDATISKLKLTYEIYQKEHGERERKLYQDLDHAYKKIDKLQDEIEKMLNESLGGVSK